MKGLVSRTGLMAALALAATLLPGLSACSSGAQGPARAARSVIVDTD
jgi:hypothetical protein